MRVTVLALLLSLAACATAPPPVVPDLPPPEARRFIGLYSLMADVGWFQDCASGQRLWVVQQGDNALLESAASTVRREPAAAVLATVDGRLSERVNMEGPKRPALLVDRFVAADAATHCPPPLLGTVWRLVQLRGEDLPPAQRSLVAELQFLPDQQLAGRGGCNRLRGSYVLGTRGELGFGPAAATLMACPGEAMALERQVLDLLPAVKAWRMAGRRLELVDAAGKGLARWEAAP